MKYEEILPEVLIGKWVRHKSDHVWFRMDHSGVFLKRGDIGKRTVSLARDDYSLDTWEVKPDESEEIYVWGLSTVMDDPLWKVSNSIGEEYFSSQTGKIGIRNNFQISEHERALFPTDKPQKYKLIPVGEDE